MTHETSTKIENSIHKKFIGASYEIKITHLKLS